MLCLMHPLRLGRGRRRGKWGLNSGRKRGGRLVALQLLERRRGATAAREAEGGSGPMEHKYARLARCRSSCISA